MPIVVRHEPVAAPMLAAYATGVGKANERRKQQALQILQQQDAMKFRYGMAQKENEWANIRQDKNLAAVAAEREADRLFRGEERADERAFRSEEREADRALRREEFDWRSEEATKAARADFVRQGVHDGTLEYTPEQKKQYQQLQSEIDKAESSGVMRPEYIDQMRAEAQQKMDEILMNPKPKMLGEEPASMEDQLRSKVPNYEKYKHLPWSINSRGDAVVDRNAMAADAAKQKEQDDLAKQKNDFITKQFGMYMVVKEGDGKLRFNREQAMANAFDDWDQLHPPEAPPVAAAPATAPPAAGAAPAAAAPQQPPSATEGMDEFGRGYTTEDINAPAAAPPSSAPTTSATKPALSPRGQQAYATLQGMMQQYGDNIPPEKEPLFRAAHAIYAQERDQNQ